MTDTEQKPPEAIHGPTIEMPKPTVWPMIVSFGMGLMAFGIAVKEDPFTWIGGFLFAYSLFNWFGSLVAGTAHIHEEPNAPTRRPVVARVGSVETKAGSNRARLPQRIYPVEVGLWGGLAGGLVMPIPAEIWGMVSGHGLWFPVNLLAGMVLPGIDKHSVPELEGFHWVWFIIGVCIHVIMSAVIGLMYGVVLPLTPGKTISHLVFGGLVIPVMWTSLSGALMGIANPLLQHHVNWYWYFGSQMVFGLAAAIVVVRSNKVDVAPAAKRGNQQGSEREGT